MQSTWGTAKYSDEIRIMGDVGDDPLLRIKEALALVFLLY